MEFGEKIKMLRLQQGLTLETVGEHVGVGKSTVRKWESGQIANMRRDKIALLADALNVSPSYLMGWETQNEHDAQENSEVIDAFCSRLKSLMNERGLKQVDILNLVKPYCAKYRIKMGKSDISQFINGKVEPGQWKLSILAMALDVSESWLMGMDVPMERVHEEAEEVPTPKDGHERAFLTLFNRLSEDEQVLLIRLMKGLLAEQ